MVEVLSRFMEREDINKNSEILKFFGDLQQFFSLVPKIQQLFIDLSNAKYNQETFEYAELARRNLKTNIKKFGPNNFTSAVQEIRNIFSILTTKGIDGLPVAEKDLVAMTLNVLKHRLQKKTKELTGYNVTIDKDTKAEIQTPLSEEERNKIQAYVSLYSMMLEQNEKGEFEIFAGLVQDAFPYHSLDVSGKLVMVENGSTEEGDTDPEESETSRTDEDTAGKEFAQAHGQRNDEKNHFTKQSIWVKTFLSSIFLKTGKPINAKFAFKQAMLLLQDVHWDASLQGIIDQIDSAYILLHGKLTNNNHAKAVYNALIELIKQNHGQQSEMTTLINEKKEIVRENFPPVLLLNGRQNKMNFLTDSEVYISTIPDENIDATEDQEFHKLGKTLLEERVKAGTAIKFTQSKEESLKAFLNRVFNESSIPFRYYGTELKPDIKILYATYRMFQARRRLSELSHYMSSLYDQNLFIAEKSFNYNGSINFTIYPAESYGLLNGVRSMIINSLEKNGLKSEAQKDGTTKLVSKLYTIPEKSSAKESILKQLQGILPHDQLVKLDALDESEFNYYRQDWNRFVKVIELVGTPKTKEDTEKENAIPNEDKAPDNAGVPEQEAENGKQAETTTQEIEAPEVWTLESLLPVKALKGLITFFSKKIMNYDDSSHSLSVRGMNGAKRYLAVLSNPSMDTMRSIVKALKGYRSHLQTDFYKLNPFSDRSKNFIKDVMDYGGQKYKDSNVGTEFGDELPSDWIERGFNTQFIDFILGNQNLKGAYHLYYAQSPYTMDRPNLMMAKVKVLRPSEIKTNLINVLKQMAMRPELHLFYEGYNRSNVISFSILPNVADNKEYTSSQLATKFLKNPQELTQEEYAAIAEDLYTEMGRLAEEEFVPDFLDNEARTNANLSNAVELLMEEGYLTEEDGGTDTYLAAIKNLIDKKTKAQGGEYLLKKEDILPILRMYYRNNYINSYFLTQLLSGDFQAYSTGANLVKRLTAAFSPGQRAVVNSTFGMKPKFRTGCIRGLHETVGKILKVDKKTGKMQSIEDESSIFQGTPLFGEEYDRWDGFGVILPERMEELTRSVGTHWGLGEINKPSHFEIVKKKLELKDGSIREAQMTVMMKYSTLVLTDDLCNSKGFEKLKTLRDNMRKIGLDEAADSNVFKTSVPHSMPSGEDLMRTDLDTDKYKNKIETEPWIFELSNDRYRLQHNPMHKNDAKTQKPKQLYTFISVLNGVENSAAKTNVFTTTQKLVELKAKRIFKKITNKATALKELRKVLSSGENDRYLDFIDSGIGLNFPTITNKLVMSLTSLINKNTVKFSFPGSKLVQAADMGIVNPQTGAELKHNVITTPDGKRIIVVECIVSEEMKELLKPGDFLYGDAVAFRLPSSGLHSGMVLQIVGYANIKANMIVTSKEIVPILGSDFDVDSLWLIRRNYFKKSYVFHKSLNKKELKEKIKSLKDAMSKAALSDEEVRLLTMYNNINDEIAEYEEYGEKALVEAAKKRLETFMEENGNILYEAIEKANVADAYAEELDSLRNLPGFKKGEPIGYIKKQFEGKELYVIDETFENKLNELEQKFNDDPTILNQLQDIKEQYYLNVITDNLSQILSDFNSNRDSILAPIKLKAFRTKISAKLEEFGLKMNSKFDLSKITDNLRAFRSVFDGAKLTGIIANGMTSIVTLFNTNYSKANVENINNTYTVIQNLRKHREMLNSKLEEYDKKKAFLSDSMVGDMRLQIKNLTDEIQKNITELTSKLETEGTNKHSINFGTHKALKIDGVTFDSLEVMEKVGKGEEAWLTLELIDTLLNAATDNTKEQILPMINTNLKTIRPVLAMVSMGVPMWKIALIMNQPAVKEISKYKQWGDALLTINRKLLDGTKYDPKVESNEPITDYVSENYNITQENLKTGLTKSFKDLTENEKLFQYILLRQLDAANHVGNSISKLATTLSFWNDMSSLPEDILRNDESTAELLDIEDDGKTIVAKTQDSFAFNLDRLFEAFPHYTAALRVRNSLRDFYRNHLLKFSNPAGQLAEEAGSMCKLDYNYHKNQSMLRDEVVKMFLSMYVNAKQLWIDKTPTKTIKLSNGKEKVLKGHKAWIDTFMDKIILLKSSNEFSENLFVKLLMPSNTSETGTKYLNFALGTDSTPSDIAEVQKAFLALSRASFSNENGNLKLVAQNVPSGTERFTDFQKDFVLYSILTNGLSFGASKYNFILPEQLLVEVSNFIERQSADIIKYPGIVDKLADFFKVSLAVNYAKHLKKMGDYNRPNSKWEPVKVNAGQITHNVYKGSRIYNGVEHFFDLMYERSYGLEKDPHIPKLIQTSDGKPYINSGYTITAGQIYAFYTKLGKNYTPVYMMDENIMESGYDPSMLFNSTKPVVVVSDNSATVLEIDTLYDGTKYIPGMAISVREVHDPMGKRMKSAIVKSYTDSKLEVEYIVSLNPFIDVCPCNFKCKHR